MFSQLSRWSARRLTIVWIAGVVLQAVLIVVPFTMAMGFARRDGARIRREVAAHDAWMKGTELADSISRAEQVASARSNATFNVRADGQTVFAVVGTPSSRPTPEQRAARLNSIRRVGGMMLAVQFGTIPLAVLVFTVAWLLARRENGPSAATV